MNSTERAKESLVYTVLVKVAVTIELGRESTEDEAVAEAISRATTAAGHIFDAQVVGLVPTVTP